MARAIKAAARPQKPAPYESDFLAWTESQAAHLRARSFGALDIENLAEEIESMGRRDRRALRNRLTILLAHLLKWSVQPEGRGGSWRGTVVEQRRRIALLLADSPSLRQFLDETLNDAFADACDIVAAETGVSAGALPRTCPFTIDQALDRRFWPQA